MSTCSKTQHSDFTGVESQTSNPSIRSLRTLYQLCVVVMVVLVCVCVGGGGVYFGGGAMFLGSTFFRLQSGTYLHGAVFVFAFGSI